VTEAESEVQRRGRRVATIEADLRSARGDARRRLADDLQAATRALEQARRGLRQTQEVARRVQILQRRIGSAADKRVSEASKTLGQKLHALDEYKSAPVPSSNATSPSLGASKAHEYAQVAKMVGLALTGQTADALAQTVDPATATMSDRLGQPLSIAGAAFHEIRANWDVYRHTPELLSLYGHDLLRRK
jgi:hypothetical protein